MINEFLDPNSIFAIWYILPGFIFTFLIVKGLEIVYPTSRIRYSKLNLFEKIVFSFAFSTLLFVYYGGEKLSDTVMNKELFVILLKQSILIFLVIIIILLLLINLVNSVINSLFYTSSFCISWVKKVLKKEKSVLINSPPFRTGMFWDIKKSNIEFASRNKREITLILKDNRKFTGRIYPSRDLLQLSIVNKKNIETILNYEDINYLIIKDVKEKLPYHFYRDMITACVWYLIISILLFYIGMLWGGIILALFSILIITILIFAHNKTTKKRVYI